MAIIAKENFVGAWAFLIGVIIAIVIGISATLFSIPILIKYSSAVYAILVILGLVVGFSINTSRQDSQTFLLSGAILVIVSKFGMESIVGSLIGIGIGDLVTSIFAALLVLFVPATIIVALKTVFGISRL